MKKFLIVVFILLLPCVCCCGIIFLLGSQGSRKADACPTRYVPVCGKDKKTYSNDCNARDAGTESDHFGICEGDTTSKPFQLPDGKVCTEIFNPVCGEDGVSYENSCIADFYTSVKSQGLCVGKPVHPIFSFNLNDVINNAIENVGKFFVDSFKSSTKN